jgi:hypothetical protein
MRVRCSLCSHEENGLCDAKCHYGQSISVAPNKPRTCGKFVQDPIKFAGLADKEYEKNKIPRFAPTWRFYATDKELKEAGAETGPKFVRINPTMNNEGNQ